MKSALDMTKTWKKIDKLVAESPMPDEFKNLTAVIACNDCLMESAVPFRFDYSKCAECGSYNTRVMSRQWPERMQAPAEPTAAPAPAAEPASEAVNIVEARMEPNADTGGASFYDSDDIH